MPWVDFGRVGSQEVSLVLALRLAVRGCSWEDGVGSGEMAE